MIPNTIVQFLFQFHRIKVLPEANSLILFDWWNDTFRKTDKASSLFVAFGLDVKVKINSSTSFVFVTCNCPSG